MDDRNPSGYAQVLEEYQGSSLSRVYNYGLALISQRQASGGTVSYFGTDGHGSTRFLLSTNGNITDTYAYDAYGLLIANTGSTPNNYLYCGQQNDADLGMYYLRARYYKPDTGRFWTMDSYEGQLEDSLSLHKYIYCKANSINGIDPSGHDDFGMLDVFDFSAMLDTLPNISVTRVGTVSLLPEKILTVHAYGLSNPSSFQRVDFNSASGLVNDANHILAQASIKLQLNAADYHQWDEETTAKRTGGANRAYEDERNWPSITQGQDRSVANVYFCNTFLDDDGQLGVGVGGRTAIKGNTFYPAAFVAVSRGSVFAHEIGHLLGLQHFFDDDNNLMYPSQSKPNPDATLTQDQINKMRTSPLLR